MATTTTFIPYISTWSRKKLKEYVRKGIPNEIRASLWLALSDATHAKQNAVHDYAHFLLACTLNEHDAKCVAADVPRTLQIIQATNIPIISVSNVLHAYCCKYPGMGYRAGLSTLAAFFLRHFNEEDTFWMMVQLTEKYDMVQVIQTQEATFKHFSQVLNQMLLKRDKKLHLHLHDSLGMDYSMFFIAHYMLLFVSKLDNDVVDRFMDQFLVQGWRIFFNVLLAIFECHRDTLLNKPYEEVLQFVAMHMKPPQGMSLDTFMHLVNKQHVNKKEL